MTRKLLIMMAVTAVALVASGDISAQDKSLFDDLVTLRDSAKVQQVPAFAPKAWKKAQQKFAEAEKDIRQGKSQKSLNKHVAEAREYTEIAIRATEVAKLTLQEYLSPRQKAIEAKAVILVPKLYQKAEIQFVKATGKVESGDVKGGLKEARKSKPLFDLAEIEAIRVDILGPADQLIKKATADDATKFALSTFDKAKSARTKANAIISADRYNRDEAAEEARRAEYEARHASNIGLSVRSLSRNDQAWEKLMLGYEIQMDRVGTSIGLEHLPFDNGPLAAADALINYVQNLQAENKQVSSQIGSLSSGLTEQLKASLLSLDVAPAGDTPGELATQLQAAIGELLTQKAGLVEQLDSTQAELAQLAENFESVSGDLSGRLAREQKFKTAKTKLNPSEGEILFNSSNDIVLRLSGLSFAIGKSDIEDQHVELLGKVIEIIELFPEALLVIEGHTDASGEGAANVTLSEKRAFAVMQYLRQTLLIPANKIQSMGYGADRPVASNQTTGGRAKNRRIDIIIMQ